ncbi:DNA polymerase III subunit alpha [Escherichia coli]|uniref:DNA polymerase III subunit alpha n=1 Tax=Escherichia coli TaxID=562 RepID=A0A2X1N2Y9_ECOLX|nr:DNA polymerase III subunit alpha [Escherichia coli]
MGNGETLGLYLTGHPINQYLKEIERYVGGVRLKDMHPTERGKVITAAGLVVCRAGYGHQARQSYRYLHAG